MTLEQEDDDRHSKSSGEDTTTMSVQESTPPTAPSTPLIPHYNYVTAKSKGVLEPVVKLRRPALFLTGSTSSLVEVIPPILTILPDDDAYAYQNGCTKCCGGDSDDGDCPHLLKTDDGVVKLYKDHPDQDGGWAWMVFFFIFVGRIIVNGTLLTFNIYFSLFLDVFKEGRASTAFIGSVMWAMYDGSGLLSAVVVEKLGPRRSIVVGSLLLTTSFLVSSSTASEALHLVFTHGVLVGLGANLVSMAFVVTLRTYFRKYVYLTQGVSTSGSGIGMFLFGFLIPELIEGFGWRGAMMVQGAVLLNLCVVGCVVFPVRKSTGPIIEAPPAPPFLQTSRKLFKSAVFWLVIASYVFFTLSYVMAIVLYKDYCVTKGLHDHFPFGLAMFGAGDIVGRLGSGLITSNQRVNPLVFNGVVHLLEAVVLVLYIPVVSKSGLMVVTFLYGLCAGCANGMFFILPCHLYSSDNASFMVAFAFFGLAAGVGSFSGTPTAGFIIDRMNSYDGALIFAGVFSLASGSLLFIVAYLRLRKERRKQREQQQLKDMENLKL